MASTTRILVLCAILSASCAMNIIRTNEYQLFSDTGTARPFGIALTPGGDQYVFGTLYDSLAQWKSFRNTYQSNARAGFIHLMAKDTNEFIWSRFESSYNWVVLRGGAADYKGNLYVCGFTQGNLFATRQDTYEFWVAKYNMRGERVWGQQFGGELQADDSWDSDLCGITVDRTWVYVSLTHRDDPLVLAQLSASTGEKTWHYTMSGDADHYLHSRTTEAMAIDTTGDVLSFIASTSSYSALSTRDNGFDSGLASGLGTNTVVLKHDSAGQLLWRQFITSVGNTYEVAFSLSLTSDDDVIMCGRTDSSTVLNGVLSPAKPQTQTGFAMRLSGVDGSVMWVRYPYLSETTSAQFSACATDKAGRIFVATITDNYIYDHQIRYDVYDAVTGATLAPRVTENPPNGGSSDTYMAGFAVDFSGAIHSVHYTYSHIPELGTSRWHAISRTHKLNTTCGCDDLDQTLGNVEDLINVNLNLTQIA